MAATLNVTCPNCGKALKVPAEFAGKRIKCKGCEKPFPVTAPKAAAETSGAKPEAPVASADRYKVTWDDNDNDGAAVGVIKEEDVPRCPHCAKELDPPDAVVCIHCGFNSRTRTKAETKKVFEPTSSEWTTHLLPGILALAGVILLLVLDVVCAMNMRSWMEGGMLEGEDLDATGKKKMFISPGAFVMFVLFGSIVAIVPLVKIGYKRLFVNYHPPETKMTEER